jgi:hypothetical protein
VTEERIKLYGPFEVEIKVAIVNPDSGQEGVVTLSMGKGKAVDMSSINDAINSFAANDMPDGFRLMNKREFWDDICYEKTGSTGWVIPGGEDWDK